MARESLTDRRMKSLKTAPSGKRVDIMDAIVPGLGVRVSNKGKKSFFLLTRFPGSTNPTRRSLGRYGAITLEGARSKAREWLELVQQGVDPKVKQQQETAQMQRVFDTTFGAVVQDYITLALVGPDPKNPLQRKGLKVARELTEEFVKGRSNGKKMRPPLKDKPIQDITPRDVIAVVDDAVKRGAQYQAHNLLGHVRTMFNWAIARGVYGVDRSPCDRMRPKLVIGRKALRTRVLNDRELAALWNGASRLGYPCGPLFKLLALTGQRKSEVAEASWSEFDFDKGLWIIPAERMKSEAPHVVPLSAEAHTLLRSLPRFDEGPFVFTTTFGSKAVNGFSVAKKRLDQEMNCVISRQKKSSHQHDEPLPHFVIHDIRRTVRTRMSALPVSSEVAELVIGHARPGLRRVYDQFSYQDEKRKALNLWAEMLMEIVN